MRFTDKPPEPFGNMILELAVPSDLSFKTPLVFRMINELIAKNCLPSAGSPGVELAFEETLINAMVHGNQLDPAKNVRVWLFADESRWGAIVEDQGEGFSPEDLQQPQGTQDLLRETGRGIRLIDGHVDELTYSPKGNRVMLVGRRHAQPAQAEGVAVPAEEAEVPEGAGPVIVTQEGDVSVAEILEAHLSGDNVHTVRDDLTQAAEAGQALVIDMHRVGYISSQAIGLLVSLYKRLRGRKGQFVLAATQPSVFEILASVNMDKLFLFAPDRDQALALARDKLHKS